VGEYNIERGEKKAKCHAWEKKRKGKERGCHKKGKQLIEGDMGARIRGGHATGSTGKE